MQVGDEKGKVRKERKENVLKNCYYYRQLGFSNICESLGYFTKDTSERSHATVHYPWDIIC